MSLVNRDRDQSGFGVGREERVKWSEREEWRVPANGYRALLGWWTCSQAVWYGWLHKSDYTKKHSISCRRVTLMVCDLCLFLKFCFVIWGCAGSSLLLGLSPGCGDRGLLRLAACRLLSAVGRRLCGARASVVAAGGLSSDSPRSSGWVVVVLELSRSAARGIFPGQGLNPSLPHWRSCILYHWATREACGPFLITALCSVSLIAEAATETLRALNF